MVRELVLTSSSSSALTKTVQMVHSKNNKLLLLSVKVNVFTLEVEH